jgi:hypothetical protein
VLTLGAMSARIPALFAAVAATALTAGGGVAYAVTHSGGQAAVQTTSVSASTSPSPSASPSSPSAPAKPRFGHFGPFMFGGLGAGGVVHGQLTVPKSGGGYQTIDVQSGTVSAVSATSVTIHSSDGYSATYAVTASTEVNAESAGIGSVKTGDTVFVTATVSGGSATAASITDTTSIGNSRGAFGFPDGPPKSSTATGFTW